MKLECDHKSLARAFRAAAAACPVSTPLPILSSVLLRAYDDVEVSGTDMERSFGQRVGGCTVERPGWCLLPADKVGQLLQGWTGDRVAVEAEHGTVRLSGPSGEFEFQSFDPAKYPAPREFAAKCYHVVSARDMKRLIARTIFAVSPDATRYAIAGVLAEPGDGRMTFTALDGKRGARQTVPAERAGEPCRPSATVSIPTKTLKLLDRHLADTSAPVHAAFTERDAIFRTEDAVVWSTLVEGRFPDLQDALPGSFAHRVVVRSDALLAAVDQAAVATDDLTKAVDFRFDPGLIRISGKTETVKRSWVQVPAQYDGPGIVVRFDPSRLAPALKAIGDGNDVVVEIAGPRDNLVFRTADDYLYMISPREDN